MRGGLGVTHAGGTSDDIRLELVRVIVDALGSLRTEELRKGNKLLGPILASFLSNKLNLFLLLRIQNIVFVFKMS